MSVSEDAERRSFGTKHREAWQSAKNLLSRFPHRISDAERKRIVEVVQRWHTGESTHGSQPSSPTFIHEISSNPMSRLSETSVQQSLLGDGEGPPPVLDVSPHSVLLCRDFSRKRKFNGKLCHGLRGKRKLNHEDCVQNSRSTKEPLRAREFFLPIEKGHLCDLHYFLRMPLPSEERLDMPNGSQPSGQPAPLLLFLHGSGERGKDDGSELHKVRKHGPWKSFATGNFFNLAPQCPKGRVWPAFVKEVLLLLKGVCARHMVDKTRVYLTGLSMGAFGCWSVASTEPQLFAAIVPICGGFTQQLPRATTLAQMLRLPTISRNSLARQRALEIFKGIVPVWLFHGMQDKTVVPQASQDIFDELGGVKEENVRKTMYANVGHACWRKAYNTLELYAWLLMHRKHQSIADSVARSPGR